MGDIAVFFGWYVICVDILALASMFFFLKLPPIKRAEPRCWLPFLIVIFSAFYENLGAYFRYNLELNAVMNAFLGNSANPRYTVWVFNIFNKELQTILLLLLLMKYLPKRQKRIITWLVAFFVLVSLLIQLTALEPLYDSQPLIFSLATGSILTACGLYFMNIISEDQYLNVNPLRLASFWQVTFLLFYHSIIFIKTVSEKYLWRENHTLVTSLGYIYTILWLLIMVTMLLSYVPQNLKLNLDKEPSCV